MSDRNDILKRLAAICQESPPAAAWTLGYLAVDASTEVLREALEGALEAQLVWDPRHSLAVVVAERYGVRRPPM